MELNMHSASFEAYYANEISSVWIGRGCTKEELSKGTDILSHPTNGLAVEKVKGLQWPLSSRNTRQRISNGEQTLWGSDSQPS